MADQTKPAQGGQQGKPAQQQAKPAEAPKAAQQPQNGGGQGQQQAKPAQATPQAQGGGAQPQQPAQAPGATQQPQPGTTPEQPQAPQGQPAQAAVPTDVTAQATNTPEALEEQRRLAEEAEAARQEAANQPPQASVPVGGNAPYGTTRLTTPTPAQGAGAGAGAGAVATVYANDPAAVQAELAAAEEEGRSPRLAIAPAAPTSGPTVVTAARPGGIEIAAPAPVPSPDDPDLSNGTLAFRLHGFKTGGFTLSALADHLANTTDPKELDRLGELDEEIYGGREAAQQLIEDRRQELERDLQTPAYPETTEQAQARHERMGQAGGAPPNPRFP